MEGAVLSGKLASEVVDDRLNVSGETFTIAPKEVHESVVV